MIHSSKFLVFSLYMIHVGFLNHFLVLTQLSTQTRNKKGTQHVLKWMEIFDICKYIHIISYGSDTESHATDGFCYVNLGGWLRLFGLNHLLTQKIQNDGGGTHAQHNIHRIFYALIYVYQTYLVLVRNKLEVLLLVVHGTNTVTHTFEVPMLVHQNNEEGNFVILLEK